MDPLVGWGVKTVRRRNYRCHDYKKKNESNSVVSVGEGEKERVLPEVSRIR